MDGAPTYTYLVCQHEPLHFFLIDYVSQLRAPTYLWSLPTNLRCKAFSLSSGDSSHPLMHTLRWRCGEKSIFWHIAPLSTFPFTNCVMVWNQVVYLEMTFNAASARFWNTRFPFSILHDSIPWWWLHFRRRRKRCTGSHGQGASRWSICARKAHVRWQVFPLVDAEHLHWMFCDEQNNAQLILSLQHPGDEDERNCCLPWSKREKWSQRWVESYTVLHFVQWRWAGFCFRIITCVYMSTEVAGWIDQGQYANSLCGCT